MAVLKQVAGKLLFPQYATIQCWVTGETLVDEASVTTVTRLALLRTGRRLWLMLTPHDLDECTGRLFHSSLEG